MPVNTSPAKRRKKNPTQKTPIKTKPIDFFFKKQGESAISEKSGAPENANRGSVSPLAGKRVGNVIEGGLGGEEDVPEHGLTDEEYARKLAAEWGVEDAQIHVEANKEEESSGSSQGVKRKHDGSSPEPENPRSSPDEKTKINSTTIPAPRKPIETTLNPSKDLPKAKEVSPQADTAARNIVDEIPFDKDPLSFDPEEYRELVKNWPEGKATYAFLTRAFVLVDGTRSRIKIVDTLVNMIRTLIRLDPGSLLPAVWLTTNDIGPPWEPNELGIGSNIITKALTKTSGVTPAALKKLYNQHGDAGDVAFHAKSKQSTLMMRKPTPLTISNVYQVLWKISRTSGKGSAETKEGFVKRLLVDAKGEEIRYLVRTLVQHLRIGAVKTTVVTALARAFSLTAPESASWEPPLIPKDKEGRQDTFLRAESILAQCFARHPDYNDLIPSLLRGGISTAEQECGLALHIPLKPMLGQITRDLSEILTKLKDRDFACEYKYDGQRAQIHCDSAGKVSIFSRHLELMTEKYPDLVSLVPQIRGPGTDSFILEGEVVAVKRGTGELMPFQALAGRERKNVQAEDIEVEVCLFAFDLMYLNGSELLAKPLRERRELLHTRFIEIPHHFTYVKSLDSTATESFIPSITTFFKSAVSSRCEGVMIKLLDNPSTVTGPTDSGRRKPLLATYTPDKRVDAWLKLKKDYLTANPILSTDRSSDPAFATHSAPDTLDLIPIGAWHGNGRKSKWWSPVLLAVRNPDTGTLDAVCKCMTGFTDKTYQEMRDFYDPSDPQSPDFPIGGTSNAWIGEKLNYVETPLKCAVWFRPKEVWEVAFADITISPVYKAAVGLVREDKGLSLRFPRFLRRREDKGVEEASTSEFLAELWWKQEQAGMTGADRHTNHAVKGGGEAEGGVESGDLGVGEVGESVVEEEEIDGRNGDGVGTTTEEDPMSTVETNVSDSFVAP